MSDTLPTVVTRTGLVPQSPLVILQQLIDLVASTNPGYTASLPGSLIEDISSTDVAAISLIDAARVETVDSLNPLSANAFLLAQLGAIYGVAQGVGANTSVEVVFSGPPGFPIAQGFTVSDGTFQYISQSGSIIGASGDSPPVFCIASISGIWVVPANTVTSLVTSVPSTISLTVTNPTSGTPASAPQTEEEYRAQVLQAGRAISQGMATMLRTALGRVSGVQPRLISIRQQSNEWEIIVGGGDPYEVANAIFLGLFDITSLTGSTMSISGATQADPVVITTLLNHGFATGQVIGIEDVVGMVELNGTTPTITVTDEKTFSLDGVDGTGFGMYVSGGVVTPNLRNEIVTINDYPDTYQIPFVRPPQQSVTIGLIWNTTGLNNFISPLAIAQLGAPALVDYINSIYAGQPINLFELQNAFQEAVSSVIPPAFLTRMVFTVAINGVGVSPDSGTGIYEGDPESYFFIETTDITITQG